MTTDPAGGRPNGWRDDRVASALRGDNPTVMVRLPEGLAVFGDVQWLPGYCVLLTDEPSASSLADLPLERQTRFLTSMAVLGQAVEAACRQTDPAFLRMNFDILGNSDHFLHAHVWPRYGWEAPDRVRRPVWLYPSGRWTSPDFRAGPQHETLRDRITAELVERGGSSVDRV